MRIAVTWFVLLCGCDKLFGLLTLQPLNDAKANANDGSAPDAPSVGGDGPLSLIDAPQLDCGMVAHAMFVSSGDSFVADYNVDLALYYDAGFFSVALPGSISASIITTGWTTAGYSAPRLSPSGTTMYFRSSSSPSMFASVYNGSAWEPPTAQVVMGVTLASDFAPGTQTLDGTRMMIQNNGELQELELSGPSQWATFGVPLMSGANGCGASITYPSLSASGKRIVYVCDSSMIFTATRANLDDAFTTSTTAMDLGPVVTTPYFTDTCAQLWYSENESIYNMSQ